MSPVVQDVIPLVVRAVKSKVCGRPKSHRFCCPRDLGMAYNWSMDRKLCLRIGGFVLMFNWDRFENGMSIEKDGRNCMGVPVA